MSSILKVKAKQVRMHTQLQALEKGCIFRSCRQLVSVFVCRVDFKPSTLSSHLQTDMMKCVQLGIRQQKRMAEKRPVTYRKEERKVA